MRHGSENMFTIFRRRRFWPQFLCLSVLFALGVFSFIFDSVLLFLASILAAFLGLNEVGRWPYKVNLLLCTGFAVAGSVGGIFSWIEILSIFFLLLVIGGFMLYYQDKATRIIPAADDLASALLNAKTLDDCTKAACERITALIPYGSIILALSDGTGGLYIPGGSCVLSGELARNGSSLWKVFASGRPYLSNSVNVTKDIPLCKGTVSVMSVPLAVCGEKIGVLQVESHFAHAFSQDDLSKLSLLAFVTANSLRAFMQEASYEETL